MHTTRLTRLSATCALTLSLAAAVSAGPAQAAYNSWAGSAPPSATISSPDRGNSSSAKACQKGGWQNVYTSSGDRFMGEGECTGYTARGGTLTDSPYPQSKTLCLSYGGTFVVGGPEDRDLWLCDGYGAPDVATFNDRSMALGDRCQHDGGGGSVYALRDGAGHATCYL